MKTQIADKPLSNNDFRFRAWRHRWAELAVALATLSLAWADPDVTKQPTNQTVSIGGTVTFRVTATTASPPLLLQWQYRVTTNDQKADLPGATKNPLTLTNVTAAQAGYYSVVVSNAVGAYTNSNEAQLIVDPTFTQINTGPLVTDTAGGWHASFPDYDGDGNLDVTTSPGGAGFISVFHNEGSGTFRKDTTNLLAKVSMNSYAHFWADYDNDGNVDLFVTDTVGNDLLFHNNGDGSFTRITGRHPTLNGVMSAPAAWGDYDRDGFLDLYVGTDGAYPGAVDILYSGNGDGTFRKMTSAEVGSILDGRAYNDMVCWVDVDNDGWPELYRNAAVVSSDNWWQNTINELFHLDKDGKFQPVDIGEMARGGEGYANISWVDYDNDGLLDAVVGTETGSLQLYRNLGEMAFTNVSTTGFPTPHSRYIPWNAVDYDNDGWLDIVVFDFASAVSTLYRNGRDGTFTPQDVGSPSRPLTTELSWGDFNNDGFLDILGLRGPGKANMLWLHNGNANHWLKVKLAGRASNRGGIGAKVRALATIGGRTFWQMREISQQGIGLDNGLIAHFGLGDATKVDLLRIEWPSGIVQELTDVAADQFLTVTETQNQSPPTPQVTSCGCAADGAFELTVTSAANNLRYVLEGATNLETNPAQWTKVQVRTNSTGTIQFTDPFATNGPTKFYRVVVP